MKRNGSVTRLSLSALLVAAMLVIGYLESLIPTGTIPGIKLGLSNSVLVLAMYWLGIPTAFLLMAAKVLLSGFLFAGVNAMMYSFAGGLLSMVLMALLFHVRDISIITLSIAGAVAHNCGQVGLAMVMLETDKLVYYMGILMFIGILTGLLTGKAASVLIRRIPKSLLPR